MNATTRAALMLSDEQEVALLAELLESERVRLLIGIRHSFHRDFRDNLHQRLEMVERLIGQLGKGA